MGKGDNRSKKGKIINGSFGVKRIKKSYMTSAVAKIEAEAKTK